MSSYRLKGVIDRFGGIEWIVFHESLGLSRPSAVIADYEWTQLLDQMNEQREDLNALRIKMKVK